MQVEFTSETYNDNEYCVTATKSIDADYIEERCVRRELIIEDIDIIMNDIEINFEDLREANKQMILKEIQEA